MLYRTMTTGFQNIEETHHIRFHIGSRIVDAIANPRLSRQINYNIRFEVFKKTVNSHFIG